MNPGARRRRLEEARLYVVTDARTEREDLDEFLEAILDAGADVVQLRAKEAEAGDLLEWGSEFRGAADRHGALFIVNDRPGVALALEADGVHLGQNDLPASIARRILGPDGIIGLSTNRPQEWDQAPPEADYLCAGPVWATPTKEGRPAAGLEYVRYAADSGERRPWFAIGGIDESNVDEVVAAGATRIVVLRAVGNAPDPAAAARTLREHLPEGGRDATGARSSRSP
ncbi:MAG: thiamine phosphate synthase [Actinomycetota bacterium]|nr:thiamine phosphate synthase [Actinomycetota bacterium]